MRVFRQKFDFEKASINILKDMYSKVGKETSEGKKSELLQNIWTMEKTMAAKQESIYNMKRAAAAMKQADAATKQADAATKQADASVLQASYNKELAAAATRRADASVLQASYNKELAAAATKQAEYDQSWKAWWSRLGIAGPLIQALIAGFVASFLYMMQREDKKQVQTSILDREFFKWLRDMYSGEQHSKYSQGIGQIHQYEQSFENKQIAHDTFQSVQTKTPGPTAVPLTKIIREDVHNVNR